MSSCISCYFLVLGFLFVFFVFFTSRPPLDQVQVRCDDEIQTEAEEEKGH